jgi:CRISPR-associated protein Cas1
MVKPSKVLKVELNEYGSYLGRAEGCFEVRLKDGRVLRYPHFEKQIGECVLRSGCSVSVDSLIDLALWNIDTYIMTRHNRVVAVLKSLEDDSHVKTRICQYEALKNGKGLEIAKQIVLSKIEGQNMVLRKYGLGQLDLTDFKCRVEGLESKSLREARYRLNQIEGKASQHYFNEIFKLFPEKLRPERRVGFQAYDGLNNVFNFGYYVLKCRVYKALLKARLEPYLGFLHSVQFGKPSLVCDFMEPYRYLIDDFLLERRTKFHRNDFVVVTDFVMRLRMGKRVHLCEFEAGELADALNGLFDRKVEVPRIKHGKTQTLDTLMCEEALLLAKFLRGEHNSWVPRLPPIYVGSP